MNKPITPEQLGYDNYGPLYAARKKVYPQSVHGTFRRIKWALMAVCLGFYYFFIELWPQEVYYFTGLLILAAVTLFLMNAVGGRIWCGYLCPQTVWTDLFYAVERMVEGDR